MFFYFFLFVGLSFSLSVMCLSMYLFPYQSVCQTIYLSICLSEFLIIVIVRSSWLATLLGMTSEWRMSNLLVIFINRGELFSIGLFIIRFNQFLLISDSFFKGISLKTLSKYSEDYEVAWKC